MLGLVVCAGDVPIPVYDGGDERVCDELLVMASHLARGALSNTAILRRLAREDDGALGLTGHEGRCRRLPKMGVLVRVLNHGGES